MPTLPELKICAKSNGGLSRKMGWRESGGFKINTSPDDLKNLNITRRSSTTEPLQAFPTIKELAQLSQRASKISDFKDEEVPFAVKHMPDWICIGTGRYSDGYCGAAYVNHKHSHVVIAHGGTDFIKDFYKDLICTDVGGVVLNKDVSQISSAYIFTKLIVNLCSDTQFSISVTGHSLGGWLAQITALFIEHSQYISQNNELEKIIERKQSNLNFTGYYVRMNNPYHLHTVSFDSPGCRRALKKIVGGYYDSKHIEWRKNVETLDFTVIIAPSNIVNTSGEHVGHILKLDMADVKPAWLVESHWIKLFVKHLSQPEPKLKQVHNVYWWKPDQTEDENIICSGWYTGRDYSCQANIFSPKELAFLTRGQTILKWRTSSIESSDMKIFKADLHMEARKILSDISDLLLDDFVLNYSVTHNVINFPEKFRKNMKINMSDLISKLIRWFRLNRVWLNGRELQNVIQALPECRQMLCESEGSLYIKRLPKLKDGKCTTNCRNICGEVRKFLGNGLERFLLINAGREGRQCRLYMVHLFNCFRKLHKEYAGEHILFIDISIVQRLSMEVNMGNIFSDTKFWLIIVECDSKINEAMSAIIHGMTVDAESKQKKLIIVTSDESWTPIKKYFRMKCDMDMKFPFECLDELSKQIISQCPVHIRENTITLGQHDKNDQYLVDDLCSFFNPDSRCSKNICEIFDGKIIELNGGILPKMAEHYIPRTLYKITLDVAKLKYNAKDFSDIIVVSNVDTLMKDENPVLTSLFKKDFMHEKVGRYTKGDFLKEWGTELISKNVHWFIKEGSMLVWQISIGQPCFDYLVDDAGVIPYSKLHDLQNNFIILADEPGMGKSAAITKLFLEYKSIGSHFNWPVYINLNGHQVELKNKAYTPRDALNFLDKASNLDCDFEKSLFRFCLEQMGNVTFFIDSFDEISQTGQDFVLQMLEQIKAKSHSKIRIWIATRNYAKNELEKKLGTKSYQFRRVNVEAQIMFLVNSWTHSVPGDRGYSDADVENFAKIFAKRAIREMYKVLGEDHTFIGIPLQLVLLALIYKDSFLQLLENKVIDAGRKISMSLSENEWEEYSHKFSSTLELYNIFVNKKLDIWLEDKFRFDTRTDWMDDILRARMNEIHSQAAFLYISSSILANSNMNVKSLNSADSDEVNRVGFCKKSDVSESTFQFYHQTMAEYFTAKYLVNLLINDQKNNVVLFLKSHYHKPYFKKIRYFLDSLLCTDIPVLDNLELFRKYSRHEGEALRIRLTNGVWDGVDALDRNILHYAMAYGNHKSGIFWMIAKDLSLFHKQDLLGETCLSYSCLSENFMNSLFPCVGGYQDDKKENFKTHGHLQSNEEVLIAQIVKLPILYSVFCGRHFQNWHDECIRNELRECDTSDDTSDDQLKTRPGSAFVTPTQFALKKNKFDGERKILPEGVIEYSEFLGNYIDRSLLTQNVEINMTWLTHCSANGGVSGISDFLTRLCLHNSLDRNPETFLSDWFNDCLGENGDDSSYELGAELICAFHQTEYYGCVLTTLRDNLPHYYHNAFPHMRSRYEFDLWKSCDSEDKRDMLLVMKNHNFYSLFRVSVIDLDFLEEVIGLVRNKGDKFKDALIRGVVIAFNVPILAEFSKIVFDIYCGGDENAKKQMMKENIEFRKSCTELEVFLQDVPMYKYNMDRFWSIRLRLDTTRRDIETIRSKFFTLPVTGDPYPRHESRQSRRKRTFYVRFCLFVCFFVLFNLCAWHFRSHIPGLRY